MADPEALARARNVAADKERHIVSLSGTLNQLAQELHELRRTAASQKRALDELQQERDVEGQAGLQGNAEEAQQLAEREVEGLQAEITRLKVGTFDLNRRTVC
jgi:translation initiation factor 2B subunit (eIF-2B alpha/beta/delta family)